MKNRVLVIGSRRILPPSFPIDLEENTGNMVHADAAFRIVRNAVFHSNEVPAHPDLVSFVNNECSHVVYVFANALRLETATTDRYERFCTFFDALKKPVVSFGLGAQADSITGTDLTLPPAAVRMLSILSDRCDTIGVRGNFTADLLKRNGVDNVTVTGCPSLYTNLRRDFQMLGARDIKNDAGSVAYAGTYYFRDAEAALLGFAINHDFLHVEASSKLLYEASIAARRATAEEKVQLPYFVEGLVRKGGLDRERAQCWLKYNFNMFWDMEAWKKFNREEVCFTFGTRFHVNMASLISGVPALWICHDSRTLELCQFMQLPHISLDEALELRTQEEIIRLADYDSFNRNYSALYDNFRTYLNRNGLPHNLG